MNGLDNGLDISESQFLKLNMKERDVMMFRNVVHNRKQSKDYAFHKKVQYVWLSVLTAITLALFGIRSWIW